MRTREREAFFSMRSGVFIRIFRRAHTTKNSTVKNLHKKKKKKTVFLLRRRRRAGHDRENRRLRVPGTRRRPHGRERAPLVPGAEERRLGRRRGGEERGREEKGLEEEAQARDDAPRAPDARVGEERKSERRNDTLRKNLAR